jgi:hypothetical protein
MAPPRTGDQFPSHDTAEAIDGPHWNNQPSGADVSMYREDVVKRSRLHLQSDGCPLSEIAELFKVASLSRVHALALADLTGDDAKMVLDAMQVVSCRMHILSSES